ncbi:MAG: extracellular solute-binding protein, partial [Oscillospiraceae bacterium]|nr:extracellular solute-binding protein [Oscillospiraceae bacterium]
NEIMVMGSDFKLKFNIKDSGDISDIVFDKAGNAYIYGYSNGGMTLSAIDTETGETGKEVPLPVGDYGSIITPGNDSDFLICAGSVVYSYNVGGEAEEIFGLVESGVSAIEVSRFFYGSEGYIFAGKSYPYNATKISLVKKQPAPENDRKEIILAGDEYSISAFIENEAVKFNNLSDDYFITVKKYGYADYDRMNMDIISGNIPDILISDSVTPIENYISKGMFADMYELIDSDPELCREDFIPSLLSACESDGKLYRFTDSFRIFTLLGKEKIFGNETLTFERLCEIAEKYPDNTEVFPGCTKYDLLYAAMDFGYIDYENAECSFDSEQFIKLLEYSDKLSDNINLDDYFNDEFWSRFETMFSDESALLMTAYLSDFTDLYRFERVQFADSVSAVGFPRKSGSGTAFVIQTGISVSAKADEKTREGAWQFVRKLLAPEYQDCVSEFPVRNDSLQKLAERDMKHDPDRANYGIVVMGGMALSSAVGDIGEPNEEDVQSVMDIIASADNILREDRTINDILAEEAANYYSGSKTAEETAELIQMRIRLYLTEQA